MRDDMYQYRSYWMLGCNVMWVRGMCLHGNILKATTVHEKATVADNKCNQSEPIPLYSCGHRAHPSCNFGR